MQLRLDLFGLDPLTRQMMRLPGDTARAKRSALSSVGWWISGELQNHIEYGGGSDWPAAHPMTDKFKKKYRMGSSKWFGRRTWGHETPLFWLGKFARYGLIANGDAVQIGFSRTRGKKGLAFDPLLSQVVQRAEQGERTMVTEAMRKFFGATRRKRPKRQVAGQTYFPLKKSTKVLETPKRPIFGPVWRKVFARIPRRFEEKFWSALERYQKRSS